MAIAAGTERLHIVPDAQAASRPLRAPYKGELRRIRSLREGTRAEFTWIAREIIKSNVAVISSDKDGKEFSFFRTEFDEQYVLKSVVGTITKALPGARQRRNPLAHPDTLHFAPDPEVHTTETGTVGLIPSVTMVIPRDHLDDYMIARQQKPSIQAEPTIPEIQLPA
jgi:hypothetical protein